jgi:hypothetical protein
MAQGDPLNEIGEKTTELGTHLYSVALKTAFLALFLVINYLAEEGIERFQPKGWLQQVEFRAIQVLFAIYTIGPLCLFIYRDLMILKIKVGKKIEAAKQEKTK